MTEPPLRKLKVSIMYSIADCHDKATVDAKAATMNSSKIFLNMNKQLEYFSSWLIQPYLSTMPDSELDYTGNSLIQFFLDFQLEFLFKLFFA